MLVDKYIGLILSSVVCRSYVSKTWLSMKLLQICSPFCQLHTHNKLYSSFLCQDWYQNLILTQNIWPQSNYRTQITMPEKCNRSERKYLILFAQFRVFAVKLCIAVTAAALIYANWPHLRCFAISINVLWGEDEWITSQWS